MSTLQSTVVQNRLVNRPVTKFPTLSDNHTHDNTVHFLLPASNLAPNIHHPHHPLTVLHIPQPYNCSSSSPSICLPILSTNHILHPSHQHHTPDNPPLPLTHRPPNSHPYPNDDPKPPPAAQ